MVDVVIDSTVTSFSTVNRRGATANLLVDIDDSTLYFFYRDSNEDWVYKKSTDAGASWGSVVEIADVTANFAYGMNVWYDRWTPGDNGTKIHIAYIDANGGGTNGRITYRSLDTSTDTLSSPVSIIGSMDTAEAVSDENTARITKARGGHLYVYSMCDWVEALYQSTDGGASWSSARADYTPLNDDDDYGITYILPGNESDSNDIYIIHGDRSAGTVSFARFDQSGNSWTASPISVFTGGTLTNMHKHVGAAVRHSDGHIIVAFNNRTDNATSDLQVADINGVSGSVTAKTNIYSNIDDCAFAHVYIDQGTDDIYLAWFGKIDGSETWSSSHNIWYAVSTDGGTTWGAAVQLSSALFSGGMFYGSLGSNHDGGLFAMVHNGGGRTITSDNAVTIDPIPPVDIDEGAVESDSQVGTPAIGIISNISAGSVQSLSQVSNPAITSKVVISAGSVQSTSQVSSPICALLQALTAGSVQSASQVSNPAIGMKVVISAGSVQSLSEVSSPIAFIRADTLLRTIFADAQDRTIYAEALPDRTIRVEAQDRIIYVPASRRTTNAP